MEESGVKSNSARKISSLNIYHTGTYLTPLESWKGAEHCPIDGTGIGHLVVEESGVESESTRGVNSINIHRTGTFLIPLCNWEATEQCPGDRNGIGNRVMEQSRFECWDRQKLARVPWCFLF